jgi:predicted metal-binding protein
MDANGTGEHDRWSIAAKSMSDKVRELKERANETSKYIDLALAAGAEDAVAVTPDDIVFDGRTLLKCMFGCSDWGKGCTCPSREGFPKPWELEPLLRKYRTVLIIHAHSQRIAQKAAFAVEREAFLDGDALAFSMSDCALCDECAGKSGQPCRNVSQARPAFHSVGIDVFSTVKKLGLLSRR